jgi:hypothetical protein
MLRGVSLCRFGFLAFLGTCVTTLSLVGNFATARAFVS